MFFNNDSLTEDGISNISHELEIASKVDDENSAEKYDDDDEAKSTSPIIPIPVLIRTSADSFPLTQSPLAETDSITPPQLSGEGDDCSNSCKIITLLLLLLIFVQAASRSQNRNVKDNKDNDDKNNTILSAYNNTIYHDNQISTNFGSTNSLPGIIGGLFLLTALLYLYKNSKKPKTQDNQDFAPEDDIECENQRSSVLTL